MGGDLEFVATVMTELSLLNIRNATRWTDVPILIQSNFDVAQAVVQCRTAPRTELSIIADLFTTRRTDFGSHPISVRIFVLRTSMMAFTR
jgi:hypothetical protein